MTENVILSVEQCDCGPPPAEAEDLGCRVCPPKMYLTVDEEDVLRQMRGIKEQVRAISDRIKELETIAGGPVDPGTTQSGTEWAELTAQLQDLRTRWKEWEHRLEEAIERKLIMLGHREPRE